MYKHHCVSTAWPSNANIPKICDDTVTFHFSYLFNHKLDLCSIYGFTSSNYAFIYNCYNHSIGFAFFLLFCTTEFLYCWHTWKLTRRAIFHWIQLQKHALKCLNESKNQIIVPGSKYLNIRHFESIFKFEEVPLRQRKLQVFIIRQNSTKIENFSTSQFHFIWNRFQCTRIEFQMHYFTNYTRISFVLHTFIAHFQVTI